MRERRSEVIYQGMVNVKRNSENYDLNKNSESHYLEQIRLVSLAEKKKSLAKFLIRPAKIFTENMVCKEVIVRKQ